MPNTYVRRMHSCQVHVRRVSGRPSPPPRLLTPCYQVEGTLSIWVGWKGSKDETGLR